tara:strand:- start:122 stop:430 length:309 start_codon:yes stop_codon:yes gene_type:complete
MITGNVVRLSGGHLVIITNVDGERTGWVSFSCSNSSGVTRNISYKITETCYDCRDVERDKNCCLCGGEVQYVESIDGMDKATVEASSVKDWITRRLLKDFKF